MNIETFDRSGPLNVSVTKIRCSPASNDGNATKRLLNVLILMYVLPIDAFDGV